MKFDVEKDDAQRLYILWSYKMGHVPKSFAFHGTGRNTLTHPFSKLSLVGPVSLIL